ncbi:MAG: ABC transporter permease [Syntrophales bacterium]|nr:ABC transporter permease [Syntrophales bacterium]
MTDNFNLPIVGREGALIVKKHSRLMLNHPAAMKNRQKQQAPHQISHLFADSRLVVHLSGEFGLKNLSVFSGEINNLLEGTDEIQEIEFDFSRVSYFDSAAALAILTIRKDSATRGVNVRLVNFHEKIERIFGVIDHSVLTTPPLKTRDKSEGMITLIGENILELVQDIQDFITFFGALLVAVTNAAFHPRSVRAKDVLFYMTQAGVNGLPIVGLINLLIGLIIAFMSFLQLRLFGANVYVPALVSFAMVKELGPIMTAILVAGRSGSAFAAEIGTMVVNEEVDALKTMGFDPVAFLAVPKVFALMIVVPILTLYADLFGIIGGLTVGVIGLDMSFNTYITQSLNAVGVFDVVTSLIKAAVFAALIAGIGCQRGFLARSGAQDVGKSTTSAVVAAIFMIVVTDSFFAIVLYYLR